MSALEQAPTAYEILGVHPSAPTELISACYWAIARDLQEERVTEPGADAALHRLTRAFESVSDPVRRGGYNLSIGYTAEPLMKRALPRRRFILLRVFRRSHELGWSVDPHEVLGLHPNAPQSQVSVAYSIMTDNYLRLSPPESRRRETLLNLLDESYAVLRDPHKRAQLAGVGPAEEHEDPPPAPDDPPASDPPGPPDVAEAKVALPPAEPPKTAKPDVAEAKVALPIMAPAPAEPPTTAKPDVAEAKVALPTSAPAPAEPPKTAKPDVAEAKVALPIMAPAPTEPPRTPKTALYIPRGTIAVKARPKDDGAVRRSAVAIAAFAAVAAGTVARGVLWVVMAIAATSVVVAGGVATAVHWAVLAAAALTMAAARFAALYARSGWLATRRWLRSSWEERKKTRENRSCDAGSQPATPDEVFLGRLASTVGKSRTERRRPSDETTLR